MGPRELSASETPTEMVMEGLYKSKLQDSVQHQIVMALYDKETGRNNWQPSYSRLKTSVRLQIDQTMRTRNFRVWNEVIDQGPVIKSQKRKWKPTLRGKWENAVSGKQLNSVQKETPAVSVMVKSSLEAAANIKDKKDDRFPPAPNSKGKTDGEGKPSKTSGNR